MNTIIRAAGMVFSRLRFIAYGIGAALGALLLMSWIFEWGLVRQLAGAPISLVGKGGLLLALVGTIASNTTVPEYAALLVLVALFGVQISFSLYAAGRRSASAAGLWGSIGGFIGGLMGVGCIACGTFVLAPVFSLVGAGGALGLAGIGGVPFVAGGIALLCLSLFITARGIVSPMVCTSAPKNSSED